MEINNNIKKIIQEYTKIKCCICHVNLNTSNINDFFIFPENYKYKKYYCSKICFNFI